MPDTSSTNCFTSTHDTSDFPKDSLLLQQATRVLQFLLISLVILVLQILMLFQTLAGQH